MKIEEFFNPYNIFHLLAYSYLSEVGEWPRGFIPSDCIFSQGWNGLISAKIADVYIKLALSGQINAMPIDQNYTNSEIK